MRAIIDIGTNSVRLLIAEKDEKEEWKITATSDEQTYFDLEYYFVKYEKQVQ